VGLVAEAFFQIAQAAWRLSSTTWCPAAVHAVAVRRTAEHRTAQEAASVRPWQHHSNLSASCCQVPLGVLNYIGIIQDDPKGNGDMRLWRPDARNDKRRLLMSTPHAAEAARWRDALEDARDQRARDGGVDRPTRARNFDASTWRLVSRCTGAQSGRAAGELEV
jgi:hypothetical protein